MVDTYAISTGSTSNEVALLILLLEASSLADTELSSPNGVCVYWHVR